MPIFLLLLGKLIPLYVLIGLGMLAGKLLGTQRETVARLLLYIIVPVVIFYGVATTHLDAAVLSVPLVFYGLCVVLCLVFYGLSSLFWTDSTRNILAYAAGTGNNGYFGLPLLLTLFGEKAFGIGVIAGLGFLFYECTLGFFMVARSTMAFADSLRRLARFPMVYAFLLGLAFNAAGWHLNQTYTDLALAFRGAYTVLGMMLVGLGLSSVRHLFVDLRFVALSFFAKFLAWPAMMFLLVWADRQFIHLYSNEVHQVMIAFSIIPLAANTVAYATELKTHPEKAASAVLLSTVFALFYIPLVVALAL